MAYHSSKSCYNSSRNIVYYSKIDRQLTLVSNWTVWEKHKSNLLGFLLRWPSYTTTLSFPCPSAPRPRIPMFHHKFNEAIVPNCLVTCATGRTKKRTWEGRSRGWVERIVRGGKRRKCPRTCPRALSCKNGRVFGLAVVSFQQKETNSCLFERALST